MTPATLKTQLRRYLRACLWLAYDGLTCAKRDVICVVVLSLVGVSTAASSMCLILFYAKWAQDQHPVRIVGVEIPLGTDLGSMLLIGLLALVVGLFSAGVIYYAESRVQVLTRNYQTRCIGRIIEMGCHRRIGRIMNLFERITPTPVPLSGLLVAGSRYAAFALRAMVELCLPLLTLAVSLSVIFWINWLVTTAIIGLSLFYVVPLYLINRGVARHHRDFRATRGDVYRRIRSGQVSLLETGGPISASPELWRSTLTGTDEFENMQLDFYGRVLATRKIALLNTVFLILSVFVLLVLFKLLSGAGNIAWPELLAYIVALRFVWTAMRQVTGKAITVSRIFPEFERYADLMRAKAMVDADHDRAETVSLDAPFLVRVCGQANAALDSSEKRIELVRAEPTLLLYPRTIDRIAMEQAAEVIVARNPSCAGMRHASVFHGNPQLLPSVSVVGNALGGEPTEEEIAAFTAGLRRLAVLDEFTSLPEGLDTVLQPADIASLSPEARYAACVAYCFLQPRTFLFIALTGLRDLKPEFHSAFLMELAASHVLLVDSSASRLFKPPLGAIRQLTKRAIVVLQDNVVRCGSIDWLEERLDLIDGILSGIYAELMPEGETADEEDLDDLDDM